MKIKKQSVKGMKNMGYLGHFAKDKFIQEGHNTVPDEGNKYDKYSDRKLMDMDESHRKLRDEIYNAYDSYSVEKSRVHLHESDNIRDELRERGIKDNLRGKTMIYNSKGPAMSKKNKK